MEKLINDYLFANKFPRNQQIKQALEYSPGVIESKSILDRIAEKVRHFVTTYIEGMGGSV
jgi:type I restriction enzyme R subunit